MDLRRFLRIFSLAALAEEMGISTAQVIMDHNFDLIILGGGCAGLSLAAHLASRNGTNGENGGQRKPRTLIIESRIHYEQDRTWCFWELPGSSARELIAQRWLGVEVRQPRNRAVQAIRQSIVVDCPEFPYAMVRSLDFYREKLATLAASGNITLLLGEHCCAAPVKQDGLWTVQTARGTYRARAVVDTRPPANATKTPPVLWQSFLGAELHSEKSVFDSQRAILMDFVKPTEGTIVFTYLLPFSANHALVETTEFSAKRTAPHTLQADLDRALEQHLRGSQYQILRRERGAIPMGGAGTARDRDGTYVNAGLRGGAARPSTGYAFQRIQRWAKDCALHWQKKGKLLPTATDPWWVRFMDQVFLEVLREHPETAPRIFCDLFAKANPASVIRFLSDAASAGDIAEVVAALPKGLFVSQAISACRNQCVRWQESPAS